MRTDKKHVEYSTAAVPSTNFLGKKSTNYSYIGEDKAVCLSGTAGVDKTENNRPQNSTQVSILFPRSPSPPPVWAPQVKTHKTQQKNTHKALTVHVSVLRLCAASALPLQGPSNAICNPIQSDPIRSNPIRPDPSQCGPTQANRPPSCKRERGRDTERGRRSPKANKNFCLN